jgi:hypothetical protein
VAVDKGGAVPAPIRRFPRVRPLGPLAALTVAALLAPAISDPTPQRVPVRALATVNSQVVPADRQTIVDLHNTYRAEVGVGPLTWDDQLAADAQKWVDKLVQRGGTLAHSNPSDPNDPDTGRATGEGENLAGGASAATAPTQWYEEKPAFDAAPNKSGFGDENPDWVNWGHYSQMVWSATTRIGCGTAPGPRYQITSCRYSPPGNFDGQLPFPGADLVQPPQAPVAPDGGSTPEQQGAPASGVPADGGAPAGNEGSDAAPAENGTPAENGPPLESVPGTGDGAPSGEDETPGN